MQQLWLEFGVHITGGSCYKYACHDTTFVATKLLLSRQNIFVATNICRDKYFVVTGILLSRQNNFCLEKKYAYHDKTFVATNTCLLRQIFVVSKIFCCHKHNFVATKIILVASPANDTSTRDATAFSFTAYSGTLNRRG